MTNTIITSQMRDALAFAEALGAVIEEMPYEPGWGDGLHLVLPKVIPLRPDGYDEAPVAWLIANDSNGYDITTQKPEEATP